MKNWLLWLWMQRGTIIFCLCLRQAHVKSPQSKTSSMTMEKIIYFDLECCFPRLSDVLRILRAKSTQYTGMLIKQPSLAVFLRWPHVVTDSPASQPVVVLSGNPCDLSPEMSLVEKLFQKHLSSLADWYPLKSVFLRAWFKINTFQ